MTTYTVKVFKADKRTKSGERLVLEKDYESTTQSMLEHTVKTSLQKGERYEIRETYVTRVNMMSGKEYTERYDTPSYCSPASEIYWSA